MKIGCCWLRPHTLHQTFVSKGGDNSDWKYVMKLILIGVGADGSVELV
jgi:hypothetical protein